MQSGRFVDMIVSLVGKVVLFDGNNIELECSDGVVAKVLCEPDSQVQMGSIYEFIGHATMDGSLQVSDGCVSTSILQYDSSWKQVQRQTRSNIHMLIRSTAFRHSRALGRHGFGSLQPNDSGGSAQSQVCRLLPVDSGVNNVGYMYNVHHPGQCYP